MKPNFMNRAAKIMAEVRNKTCIDDVDTEVIAGILQDELIEYHNEVFTYGHNIGYDDGHADGHAEGHYEGHAEGYALGYSDGSY